MLNYIKSTLLFLICVLFYSSCSSEDIEMDIPNEVLPSCDNLTGKWCYNLLPSTPDCNILTVTFNDQNEMIDMSVVYDILEINEDCNLLRRQQKGCDQCIIQSLEIVYLEDERITINTIPYIKE